MQDLLSMLVQMEEEAASIASGGKSGSRPSSAEQTKQKIEERCIVEINR